MIIGAIMMLIGFGLHLPVRSLGQTPLMLIAVVLVFTAVGIGLAWKMWPSAVTHIKAANWDAPVYQRIGQRSMGSGKSTRHEMAIRYDASGRTYENVVDDGPEFGLQTDRSSAGSGECRVNPEKPWQVAMSWGWRPGLGMAVLFPMAFLSIGLLFLLIPFSPTLRSQLHLDASKQNGWDKWEEAAGAGFTVLFTGSIVGVFVSACAEMWTHRETMRWVLTPFLVPFVYWVLALIYSFVKAVRKALCA